MAWSIVQSHHAAGAAWTSPQSTNTGMAASAANNKIIVCVEVNGTTQANVSSVTDNNNNTYTKVVGSGNGINNDEVTMWEFVPASGQTISSIKVTFTGSGVNGGFSIQEVSGLSTSVGSGAYDGTPGSGVNTSSVSPSAAATADNEFVKACQGDNGTSTTAVAGSGWTKGADVNDPDGIAEITTEHQNSTNGIKPTTNWTTALAGNPCTLIAIFKLAAAGATGKVWPERVALQSRSTSYTR